MLRGLQHNLEIINKDLSAKVLMLSSAVPKVFCAGADLKVGLTLCRQLCSFTELLHQKSVCHCCQLLYHVSPFFFPIIFLSVVIFFVVFLQERKAMSPDEAQSFINTLRSTFSFLEVCPLSYYTCFDYFPSGVEELCCLVNKYQYSTFCLAF